MIKIGAKSIGTNIFLASLAGISDLAYRLIAREHGAQICFYEMFDSNALVYTSRRKTNDDPPNHPQDLPIAAQLLGSDPDMMLTAAQKILELNKDITFLDINAACPMRKVIKKRSGAYLINEPDMLYRIISRLSASLPLPITVKLRTGYQKNDVDKIILIAKNCEQHGAKAIFVHGRTKAQIYSGNVDHASIKAIKDNVKIPVVASGNIFSALKAKEMIDLTGCDGVLVARGSFGNPWIFQQVKTYLQDGILLPDPPLPERLATLKRHVQYIEKHKILADKSKLGFSRKIAVWYLKNFRHATDLRNQAAQAKSFPELYGIIENVFQLVDR